MNEHDPRVKNYLGSLDEPPLPEGLWQRLERRRRSQRLVGTAAASVAALALAVMVVPWPGSLGDPGTSAPQFAGEAAPQSPASLEADLLALRAIDSALQAAYDRNASDDEVEPLWQARRELLEKPLLDLQKKREVLS